MSFPHLPCLLMRLNPDGVRTSAKLQIKFHITSEYVERQKTKKVGKVVDKVDYG